MLSFVHELEHQSENEHTSFNRTLPLNLTLNVRTKDARAQCLGLLKSYMIGSAKVFCGKDYLY